MNFEHTDEQKMLADTVRRFCEQDSPVARARALRDDAVRPSLDAATPLALAPAVEEGHFLVPPVLEIEGKP